MLTKPYPKDNKPRTLGLPADLVDQLDESISARRLGPQDLLFATRDGTPISRNTFRTRVWLPAVKTSGVDFDVRVHDLRHAHASWLLAGGSDLKSVMDRWATPGLQLVDGSARVSRVVWRDERGPWSHDVGTGGGARYLCARRPRRDGRDRS